MAEKRLILASASPRRREILESAGYVFDIISPDADEVSEGLSPAELTVENSRRKACAALKAVNGVIICADTVVCLDGMILGKPDGAEGAKKMLSSLSGRSHSVITGYTVTDGAKEVCGYVETTVHMRPILPFETEAYVATGSPLDKAGAYGIQEWIGYIGVTGLEGSYFNVMGLPIQRLYNELKTF